mmetsp:Transcript_14578/g.18482  ORF Transcript_14578/g.18482 Transcript_14578/m.18482 type:complete len:201 (-) Transcript_14578:108-710(-)
MGWELFPEFIVTTEFVMALTAILVHVLNYNVTAQLEYHTRCFTKLLGRHAVYYYAVYLVFSALIRDQFVHRALIANSETLVLFPENVAFVLSSVLFVSGILLNLWTLKALGIKGMYNGDSFGHLMKEPVTSGPYKFFQDPQYVGTTWCMLSSAIAYQSYHGYVLTVWLYLVFNFSVKFIEGPHMYRIYNNAGKIKEEKEH